MINFDFENKYANKIICGSDEVGRGPLAGPVVAAAVITGADAIINPIEGINDSKKISSKKRELLFEKITKNYQWAIGEASIEEIDDINILNATKLAIKRAVEKLLIKPEVILVDGNMKFADERYISIIKGDQSCYSIACASIIAKVYRDNLMKDLANLHPVYGWEKNAGYGTKFHLDSLKENGATIHHRKSFIKLK